MTHTTSTSIHFHLIHSIDTPLLLPFPTCRLAISTPTLPSNDASSWSLSLFLPRSFAPTSPSPTRKSSLTETKLPHSSSTNPSYLTNAKPTSILTHLQILETRP
jgi:hypothetical protein